MLRRPPAAVSAVALVLALTGVASAGSRDPELGRISAEGAVTLKANQPGVALLHGERMVPGDSITSLITLTNTGDRPGALALSLQDIKDQPGRFGGRLSSVMRLRLDDLTSGRPPVETPLARTTPVALGTLPGKQGRTYRVTATFPDTGLPPGPALGDNRQQGSRVELALLWQITEAAPTPTPTPAKPKPRPKPPGGSAPPAVTPAPGPAPVTRPALVHLRVPAQRVIKPRKLAAFASCDVRCKLRFSAKIDDAPVVKKGKKAKKRKTLMAKRVIKKEKRWIKVKRVGREKRYWLKLTPKALKRLKAQLHRKGRVGITVTAKMRSSVGNRTVRRRIIMRTYKKGERARPAPLR